MVSSPQDLQESRRESPFAGNGALPVLHLHLRLRCALRCGGGSHTVCARWLCFGDGTEWTGEAV